MHYLTVAAVFLLVSLAIPSRAQAPQTSNSQAPNATQKPPDTEQHSSFDPTAKWPITTFPPVTSVPTTRVYVCWENPDTKYVNEMALVQTAVASSWEAASGLHFTGWQKCAPQNRGIRILIEDSGPHTKGLGSNLDGKQNGMVLNFTFDNWGPACKTMREYCIKTIAVHEFGHGIGFAHEQNRPDAPGECQKLAQGANGPLLLTPYDPESVMNYCNPKYNNNGRLSKYDTQAVQKIYGSPSDRQTTNQR
jgi:hypothetical protein